MKEMRRYLSGMILGIIVLCTACSSDVYTQKFADNSRFKNYRTYAWLPAGDTIWNDFNKDAVVSDLIRNAVDNDLQDIGYQLNSENPDFLVLVHTNYQGETEIQQMPSSYNYYGPGFYPGAWNSYYYPYYNSIGYVSGPGINVVSYTEGTIVIDLIDTKSKKIVWRGTSSDAIYNNDPVEEMAQEVDHIFKKFPVENI